MGTAALALGVVVVLVTIGSQVGLGPDDFATVAALGLVGAAFALVTWVRSRSRAALGGLLLSLMPLVLLTYFLAVTDG